MIVWRLHVKWVKGIAQNLFWTEVVSLVDGLEDSTVLESTLSGDFFNTIRLFVEETGVSDMHAIGRPTRVPMMWVSLAWFVGLRRPITGWTRCEITIKLLTLPYRACFKRWAISMVWEAAKRPKYQKAVGVRTSNAGCIFVRMALNWSPVGISSHHSGCAEWICHGLVNLSVFGQLRSTREIPPARAKWIVHTLNSIKTCIKTTWKWRS